jgi:hypothetical protein
MSEELDMDIKDAVVYLVNNWISNVLAIVAIAGFIGLIKPVGRSIKRFIFAELYAADEKHDKRMDDLEMQQLKQIICDCNMPEDDRIDAGDKYLERGGNGKIKARYEALKRAYIAEMEQQGKEK